MSFMYENAYESRIQTNIRFHDFASEKNLEIFLKDPNVLRAGMLRTPMESYSFSFNVISGPECIDGDRENLSKKRSIMTANSILPLEEEHGRRENPLLHASDVYFLGRIAGSLGVDRHLSQFYAHMPYKIDKRRRNELGIEVELGMLTAEQAKEITTSQRRVTTPKNATIPFECLMSKQTNAEFLQNGDLLYRHETCLIMVTTIAQHVPTA